MVKRQSAYLFIFVHLPKSAGTTLNHHFKKNLRSSAWCQLQNQLQYLPNKHLRYIFGHTISKGVEKQLPSPKKPFYFTFLRDPAKRIVSLYNYYSGWYWRDQANIRNKKDLYKRILLLNGRYPDFWDWYTQVFKPGSHKIELTTTTGYYQHLGYLANGKLSDKKIKDYLQNFDFIGTTETFSDDALYLYGLNNFHKFFINQNISDKFFRLSDYPEIEKKLKADLTDDYRLYEAAKTHHWQYLNNHPQYYRLVATVSKQRQFLLPFTQLLYGWPENLRLASSYLRKTFPIYGKIKDKIFIV